MTRSARAVASGFCAALLLLSPLWRDAWALNLVIAQDGTDAAVNAALKALGGPGVVVVPPAPTGGWQVKGEIEIPYDDVTLIGCGEGQTKLWRDNASAKDPQGNPLFASAPAFVKSDGKHGIRVSEITFEGNTAGDTKDLEIGVKLQHAQDFRVDHCTFRYTGNSGVMVSDVASTSTEESWGVVDGCTFFKPLRPVVANLGYGVSVYGNNQPSAYPLGSATTHATYVEQSEFEGCRHAIAGNAGGRFVFRYNTVTANVVAHAVDMHGDEYNCSHKACCHDANDKTHCPNDTTPELCVNCPMQPYSVPHMGSEWGDIYKNEVSGPSGFSRYAVRIRGGRAVLWGNVVSGYDYFAAITQWTPQATVAYLWASSPQSLDTDIDSKCPADRAPYCKPAKIDVLKPGELPPAWYHHVPLPHPSVDDLVARAGPDQNCVLDATGTAAVFVDASASSAKSGAPIAHRWYLDGKLVSACARDVLRIGEGTHVLLLEADSGSRSEVDTSVVRVSGEAPLASAKAWGKRFFVPRAGKGTVSFTLTPSAAKMDGYVGVTGWRTVLQHDHHAMQVLAGPDGRFSVRDGDDKYRADMALAYEPAKDYRVQMAFDTATRVYDVRIDDGTGWRLLAKGYAFRSQESAVAQMTAFHATGGLSVRDIAIHGPAFEPGPACGPSADAGQDVVEAATPAGDTGSSDQGDAAAHGADPDSASPDARSAAGSPGAAAADAESAGGCGCSTRALRSRLGWLVITGVFWLASAWRRRARRPVLVPAAPGSGRRRPLRRLWA
jgi:hypothetical protein